MERYSPLVSVLIANYNNGCYLLEAINSIRMQEYSNWEIIIVDDKSTDDSYNVYSMLENDPQIHIYYNETNRGVGFTKRRCVGLAKGEICGFLDPDDVLFGDGVIGLMVDAHYNHPNASLVYSGLYRADSKLNIIKDTPGVDVSTFESALHSCSWPIRPFATFKRNLYLKTEGIDSFMRNAEDYDLYYKLEEVGDIIHLSAITYIQRNNPNSISLNGNHYKSAIWHSYACINAMRRRGIEGNESLMLFPVEAALREAFFEGYKKATASRVYKMGKILLSPVLAIANLWKKSFFN